MSNDPFLFHAYLGPRHVAADDPTLYGHWSYAQDVYDNTVPPQPFLGQMTLTSAIYPSTTNFSVSGGTGTPVGGGLWVGPNGAGQSWEYISYYKSGSTFIAERRIPEGQTGNHSIGAPVYFWYPLKNNVGTVQYDEEMSDNTSTVIWTAKLGGIAAPVEILRPEHVLLVTITKPGQPGWATTEAGYHLYLIGLVERVSMSQDMNMNGAWDLDIVSSARLLQVSQTPAVRIGPLDVATEASVQASSSLGANWKLVYPQVEEVAAGLRPEIDLVELQTDCEPSHITDGNDNTLWVSDGWTGQRYLHINGWGKKAWASIFAVPPPVDFYGSKYIELVHTGNLHSTWYYMFCKWKDKSGVYHKRWFQCGASDVFAHAGVADDAIAKQNQRLIIAEDAAVFNRIFPSAKAEAVVDASVLLFGGSGTEIEMVRRLWWEAGALFLRWTEGGPSFQDNFVSWGDVTKDEMDDEWQISGSNDFEDLPGLDYHIAYGPYDITQPNLRTGQVFRRDMTQEGSTTHKYFVDYIHAPGYMITDYRNGDDYENNQAAGNEWLTFNLPEMSHFLFDDLEAGATSIRVVDSNQHPNVEGLSLHTAAAGNGGGVVIIDTEAIAYTGKDYKTGTLTGCTVNGRHRAGTRVYVRWNVNAYGTEVNHNMQPVDPDESIPMEGAVFRMATACYPLETLQWGRGKFSDGSDRWPYPVEFMWWFSLSDNPLTPTTPYFKNAYLNPTINSVNFEPSVRVPNASADLTTPAFAEVSSDAFRPKSMMMMFGGMADKNGNIITARPMLNYVKCLVDRRYYNPATWLEGPPYGAGSTNELQIREVMKLSGQGDVFFMTTGAGSIARRARGIGVTEAGNGWQVVSDMADYSESLIRALRFGRIEVGQNAFLLSSSHDPEYFFDNRQIMSMEIVNVRPSEVGQVRLNWEDPFHSAAGMVVYPPETRPGGSIVDVGPMLAENQTEANIICKNLFLMKRYSYNIFVELDYYEGGFSNGLTYPAGFWGNQLICGQIHQLEYDFLGTYQPTIKVVMVESISRTIQDGKMRLQVGYREIDKESY